MKKPIGVDIDGCLNSYHINLIKYIQDEYGIRANENTYYMVNALNFSSEQEAEFWKKFDLETLKIEIEVDVNKFIKKISKNFEINIITARLYQSAVHTESWLKDKNIYYNKLYLNAGNKLDVCKWKNIEIMIEDNPDNAIILAQNGIKVLLFERPYNKSINHENIIRCKNWNEIYREICLLSL